MAQFHLRGQLAAFPPARTRSTGFLERVLGLPIGARGCHSASARPLPPLPSPARTPEPTNRRGPDVSRLAAPPRRAGLDAPSPRARGDSAGERRASQGLRPGRRQPRGERLKVPSTGGPDDRTTARCGRHKACQSAREEREQSWLSPVSMLRGDPAPAAESALPGQTSLPGTGLEWNLSGGRTALWLEFFR